MWAGAKTEKNASIMVNGINVAPSNSFELLGITVDNKLSFTPHVTTLAKATRCRASMVARLVCHLPRDRYLLLLSKGIVMGKVGYAVAVVTALRLERVDHVRIPNLLSKANIPSLNVMAVRAVAMKAWNGLLQF